ncbi:MAG: NAD(P)/FAD-dependent oxidoreductase [Spirochaetia bacterium]
MKDIFTDVAVIGGGAAGMAAALEIRERGHTAVIIEREERLGGILLQCIHNGFGLIEFEEELTGPEYAENFFLRIHSSGEDDSGIETLTGTTVVSIEMNETEGPVKDGRRVVCVNARDGIIRINCRAAVLAMGCRERNRGNLRIPGTRPSGIYTAGLAQRLINMEGYIPGKEAVIIGSGDIGLIVARRMVWSGCRVRGVVEILPYPSGLTRNIVQCLADFDIPLYLSHIVTRIYGRHRMEGVDVTPLENGVPDYERRFHIPCDTLLISAGLIPENELSKEAGVEINPQTGGPLVDATRMTSVEGLFAAGNVLHVHDIVDYVTEEARRTGGYAADYIEGIRPARQVRVRAGSNVRYVNPTRFDPTRADRIYFRSLIVKNKAMVTVSVDGKTVREIKKRHVQPSEMVFVDLSAEDFRSLNLKRESLPGGEPVMEVSIR